MTFLYDAMIIILMISATFFMLSLGFLLFWGIAKDALQIYTSIKANKECKE